MRVDNRGGQIELIHVRMPSYDSVPVKPGLTSIILEILAELSEKSMLTTTRRRL